MMDPAKASSFFDQFALGPASERTYTRIAEPLHSQSRQLIEFWRVRSCAGGFVVGLDIPSRAISGILPNLIVYEPLADCSDFRVRHAGTAYIGHYGMDVTGKLMSELFDAETSKHNRMIAKDVIGSDAPYVLDANLRQLGIMRQHYEIVLLPVWSPAKIAKWMLCGVFKFA